MILDVGSDPGGSAVRERRVLNFGDPWQGRVGFLVVKWGGSVETLQVPGKSLL